MIELFRRRGEFFRVEGGRETSGGKKGRKKGEQSGTPKGKKGSSPFMKRKGGELNKRICRTGRREEAKQRSRWKRRRMFLLLSSSKRKTSRQ